MAEKTEFIAGIVVGALVGVGLGLLLAPQSGHETRQRLRGRADEMGTRLRTRADEMGSRLRSRAEELGDRVRQGADELAQRGRMAYEEGSRRLREAYDRSRETGAAEEKMSGGLEENESV